VAGPVLDDDGVASADVARLDDPQVRAGPGDGGEPLDPAFLLQPALEGATGDPGAGNLEDDLGADAPALADQRAIDVDTLGGEVLAEDPVGQFPADLGRPEVEVFPRVGVDGLVGPAVMLDVEDPVAGQAHVAGPLGRGRPHRDRSLDRLLVDASQLD
jgi:hypothetical protein